MRDLKSLSPHNHPRGHPSIHKVVSLVCTASTTYPFVISKRNGMTFSQVIDEVLYTGLLEMQELDAPRSGHNPTKAPPTVTQSS